MRATDKVLEPIIGGSTCAHERGNGRIVVTSSFTHPSAPCVVTLVVRLVCLWERQISSACVHHDQRRALGLTRFVHVIVAEVSQTQLQLPQV
jgi:hypothetical protein